MEPGDRQDARADDEGALILIVEDNALNLKLFSDLLRAHNYRVEGLSDGRDALARAREVRPQLIITDIQLPHISGLELIEQLKSDGAMRDVPIMAVTAYAGRADEERVRAAGAEAYVPKPISLQRFVGEVQGLLALAGASDAPAAEWRENRPPALT